MLKKITFILFISMLPFFQACEEKEVVKISGRQLLVNDKPYTIKGICYHPVPKGSNKRDFNNLTQDLALMIEAGINTIRVYEPIDDISILDQIAAAGLKIIVGIGYDQEGFYDIFSGTFINYINKYKNHSAILFWELGNEYNYHPEWFKGDLKNWYTALDHAAELIHQNDLSHPVATAHGELPDIKTVTDCPNIDIWGMNVYRWDSPGNIFSEWTTISSKPMYLSEAGADSYMAISKNNYQKGVNEDAQADATAKILNSTFGHQDICLGLTLFSFIDELWKAGNNDTLDPGGWAPYSSGVPYDGTANEEYWGIVDIERKKKKAYHIVKEKYINLSR